jgi:5,10-methylenetetrahydrofolate reductase
MTFGPCGGVDDRFGCEVDGRPCPFCAFTGPPRWRGAHHAPRPVDLGRYVTDLRPSTDPGELRAAAGVLASFGATALLGEHLDDPGDEPPHAVAAPVVEAGVRVVATLTGRDRTPEQARSEIGHMADVGVTAVHCVTGDHPAVRFGPRRTARFPLDGTRLAALARAGGCRVSVAESPATPPVDWRPIRLLDKQRAGADVAILNHGGAPAALADFARRASAAGVSLPLVAPVPVVTDQRSARALTQFPGLALPAGLATRVLSAVDGRRAGIDAAIEIGAALLAGGHFATVDLSGSAGDVGLVERVEIMAEVAAGIEAR